jgi:beta-glucosidase/6-phospho-beta-glucosidase/beta-galactosidase
LTLDSPLLQSFWMGGFEGGTHRRGDGLQVDVLRAMRHDTHAAQDYSLLAQTGIRTVRDALRWHRIERSPGQYDWSSFLPMLRASQSTGTQVIWDLCHWGLPPDIDVFSPSFIDRFARFAGAAARVVADETSSIPFYAPMNEMSFWSWIGGDVGAFYPYRHGAGDRLKHQLVRAAIAATQAVRAVDPRARFLQPEPLIHISENPAFPLENEIVARYNESQYAVYDLLSGRLPDCGGDPSYLDILGVNYYWNNQWMHRSGNTPLGHLKHRSLSSMLIALAARYDRPVIVSETGAEGESGPGWMTLIDFEARRAMAHGVPLQGICLYPVSDYPGWDDDRHCDCGVLALDARYNSRTLRTADTEALHLLQHLRLPV